MCIVWRTGLGSSATKRPLGTIRKENDNNHTRFICGRALSYSRNVASIENIM